MVHAAGDSQEFVLRKAALDAAQAYNTYVYAQQPFVPGQSPVPVSGKYWGAEEIRNLVDASLDFWLTAGRYNDAFEETFAKRLGRRFALTVNSGSSANLLAVSALCSPLLKERRLKPGDEVITVAAGFPTTVAPLVQHGLVPVFVDACPPLYNAVPEQIADAVGPRTRAIFMAHTLGNPFDIAAVKAVADKHDLWFVEDSCDALGSTYTLGGKDGLCGSFGHIGTFSFYPAHHITMGEGGAVVCNDPLLRKILLSLRDWGRECWCPPGRDDTCKQRYSWQFAELPEGYDHKYVYSHLGYNLKLTDMQAAVGLAQLNRLDEFTAARRRNFDHLHTALAGLDGDLLTLPQPTAASNPSWFGFLLTLHKRVDRQKLLQHLNSKKIGTRLLFAGNIVRQPCFADVPHRIAAPLEGTDIIMRRTFWVGVYPGLSTAQMEYTGCEIKAFLAAF
jgi:CDP-6-deoxy-D-xylo-4-hexulose-3-dehydrase